MLSMEASLIAAIVRLKFHLGESHRRRFFLARSLKNDEFPDTCKLLPKSAQSKGSENMGLERTLFDNLGNVPINSTPRITLENNVKICAKPQKENTFAMAVGGGRGTGIQPSPAKKYLFLFAKKLARDIDAKGNPR